MSTSLNHTDTLPWYRQFWPWFIFGLPGTVVVAALATLYIANRHADDLVVDDYYKVGLAINKRLEREDKAKALEITARLALTADRVIVTVAGQVNSEALALMFSHPLESDRDFAVRLHRTNPGQFLGALTTPVAQRWHWSLQDINQIDWRLDGTVTAADFRNGSGD